jgi:hypothetical protein
MSDQLETRRRGRLSGRGHDGFAVPGSRQHGWGWFDASRNELLRDTGCVVGDVVQHSLTSADIPEATVRQLAVEAMISGRRSGAKSRA